MENVKYKISTNLIFDKSDISVKSDIVIVNHIITRKKYQLSKQLYELIILFNQELTIKQAKKANNDKKLIPKNNIDINIEFLINSKILVASNLPELRVQSSDYPNVFNVDTFYPQNDNTEIVFLGIPFGYGNKQNSNCNTYPDALRKHQLSASLSLRTIKNFEVLGNASFENLKKNISKNLMSDWGNLYMNLNEDFSKTYNTITETVESLFNTNKIPFILGGDHSITFSIINAAKKYHSEIIIFHFDAHLDTYKRLDDNLITSNISHNHANFMSKCLNLKEVIHVFQFGIRGISNINTTINRDKQSIIWAHQFKDYNIDNILKFCGDKPVYLSFDIDFLDVHLAPATSTPVINGCSMVDFCSFLNKLEGNVNIIGVDMVEINPTLDKNDITMENSVILILNMLNAIKLQ